MSWPQHLTLNNCSELWFIFSFTQHSCLIGLDCVHSRCSYVKNNCSDCSVYNYKVKSMSHLLWRFSEVIGLFHWTNYKKGTIIVIAIVFSFFQYIHTYQCPFWWTEIVSYCDWTFSAQSKGLYPSCHQQHGFVCRGQGPEHWPQNHQVRLASIQALFDYFIFIV